MAIFRHKVTGQEFIAETYSVADGTVWLSRLRVNGEYLLGGDAEIDVAFVADPVDEDAVKMLADAMEYLRGGDRRRVAWNSRRRQEEKKIGYRFTDGWTESDCGCVWNPVGVHEAVCGQHVGGPRTGALAVEEDWPADGVGGCRGRNDRGAKCTLVFKHTGTPHRFCQRHPHDGFCTSGCFP